MTVAVRYYSRGGNTKKVAEAMAKAVGVKALPITEPLTEDVDILLFGTAPYAFDIDDEVKSFLRCITVSVGKVVNFSTAAVLKSTRKYVEKALQGKGIPLAEEEFSCRGAFTVLHKGHPDEADLKAASDFARNICS